ncbi:MAG: GNAT family N-acetyltransferase [Acutalibacteraceae bacterium]|nr:GNAT family N-acetyltransferase [Acutalibacteraceae bacterium]
MKINYRKLLPRDNTAMAELIRYNLKANGLDIPGTVYFDEIIWHLTDFYDEKPEQRAYFVLVDDNDKVVGGIGLAEFPDIEGCAELQKLYLADEAKGHGLGYFLIDLLEKEAVKMGYRKMYLETHTNLQTAIHVYEKAGYLEISRPEFVMHNTMNKFYIKDL